jgi:YVTN family beta-propeller protein
MEPVFRILGPLDVTRDAQRVSLGGRRERAILAILLLHRGEVVSVERLIDGVWGDARPASAKHMVHEYVSRLRQALGDVPIATRPPGYLLEWADPDFDARLFTQLTAAARESAGVGDHGAAVRAYDEALALWRGDALADVGLEGQALIAATRLDQERQLAGEERIDSALALGRHLQLIPELEHRVEEAPLRERPRAQLMLALYRAGRQTEALERYREGRMLLVEHAGVEPGRDLRQLERAILTQDPALDLAAPMPRGHAHAPRNAPSARHWKLMLALGAVLAATVVAIVLVVGRSGSAHALTQLDANSAGAIDPGRNELVDQVPVGTGPGRVVAGFGSIWVVNDFAGTVSRIDPHTGTVVQTITVDSDPTAIAVGAGFVWVACTGTRRVDRINPQDNKLVPPILVGNGPSGIAMSPGAVWVTDRLDDTVTKIDASTGRVLETLPAGPTPSDIAYGLSSLWIANESSGTVTRLDPATGVPQEITVGNGPEAVAVGYGSVWVANSLDGTVSRIDPTRNAITYTITVGSGPSSVLASDGAIWVADSYGGRIVRIDPGGNHIVKTIDVHSGPQSLAAIDGRIWLSARETTAVHRGGTLRLFSIDPPNSLDEQLGYANIAWQVLSITGDGLVGFKRVGGLDGGTLVPDLATALPIPTNGGRTYAFQLRPGIHYSNGDPVLASDVRRGLERWFRLGSEGLAYYSGLVGGDACSKARCDLSQGVVTNDRAGTVILNLRKPDPELFYKLALPFADPVPPGVPMAKPVRLGVPGTGPYVIQSHAHRKIVLVRNPEFHEWSAAAQPVGYPDRIVWTLGNALGKQLTAIEHGEADFMQSPLPVSRRNELTSRYAAQVHVFPASATFALFLNTRVPPFNNLQARRAVEFAIDRAKAASLFDGAEGPSGFGGVKGAVPTCQIVPAGIVGYRPYCPYTRHPTATGVWTGPDLARAQKLVNASGTRGEKVVFWTGPKPLQRVVGRLAVATLRKLGYRASLKTITNDGRYFEKIDDSRTRAQAGFYAWSQDYPAASNFLSLFTCREFQVANINNVNASDICDRRVDQAVDRALERQTDNGASTASWAAVDHLVTDLAPWVPIVNTREVVVVSTRVRNLQSNPQWGVLFDQIWIR